MADEEGGYGPSIPDLKKKKEKERKKGGAAWTGSGATGAFEGATGGIARSAASAASAAAGAGELTIGSSFVEGAFANFLRGLLGDSLGGWLVRLIAPLAESFLALTSTLAGKMAVAAAAALILGAAALIAARLWDARTAPGGPGVDLGPLADHIKVREGGDASLKFAADANRGQLFDGTKTDQGDKTQDAGKTEAAGKTDDAGKTALDNGDIQAAQGDRLAHDLSGAKLTSDLGGGAFGAHDIFAGSPYTKSLKTDKLTAFAHAAASSRGKAASQRAVSTRSASLNFGRRGIGSSRSLGRLMSMATLNSLIRPSGPTATEANSQTASDQFESQQTTGGSTPAAPPGATPAPVGGGTPNIPSTPGCSDPSACVNVPNTPQVDVTPWSGLVQSAIGMINTAVTMLILASILFAVMMVMAKMWLTTGCSAYMAAIITAIAFMLAGIFAMMVRHYGSMVASLGDQVAAAGSPIIGDTLKKIGGDLQTGAFLSITVLGGLWMAMKIKGEENTLTGEVTTQENSLLQQGGGSTPISNGGGQTSQNPAP